MTTQLTRLDDTRAPTPARVFRFVVAITALVTSAVTLAAPSARVSVVIVVTVIVAVRHSARSRRSSRGGVTPDIVGSAALGASGAFVADALSRGVRGVDVRLRPAVARCPSARLGGLPRDVRAPLRPERPGVSSTRRAPPGGRAGLARSTAGGSAAGCASPGGLAGHRAAQRVGPDIVGVARRPCRSMECSRSSCSTCGGIRRRATSVPSRSTKVRETITVVALTALLVLADPLIGFAVYFGLWHSLNHSHVLASVLGRHMGSNPMPIRANSFGSLRHERSCRSLRWPWCCPR